MIKRVHNWEGLCVGIIDYIHIRSLFKELDRNNYSVGSSDSASYRIICDLVINSHLT